jgi:hypothetical protein
VLDILGFVGKGATTLYAQLGVEMARGFFSFFPFFPWSYGLSIANRSSEVAYQVTGSLAVFGSFCLQGRLQLGPEVTHYQFM